MTTPYNPPTTVRSLTVQFKSLVVRADPDFEAAKRNEVTYETSGRIFRGDNTKLGPYAS